LPIQRAFFVGGLHTVRGQLAKPDSAGRVGNAFWLSRNELGLSRSSAIRPTLFLDVGWAGSRNDYANIGRPLSGAGVGLSMLEGLLRIDVARGIWPEKRWRTDFYLGSVF
jgi:hemolysin activation/secretion protein